MIKRDYGTRGERFVGWVLSYPVRFFLLALLVVAVLTCCADI